MFAKRQVSRRLAATRRSPHGFGLTALEQLICGYHVHVAVASDEERVGVLDRIKVWLPVLLALD